MIRQTIFAVAVSDLKPVHKGIKFEVTNSNLRLISCDGFRLAIRNEATPIGSYPKGLVLLVAGAACTETI